MQSCLFPLLIAFLLTQVTVGERSFVIDYENDRFLKDGQPFQYVSGSMHYFRVPSIYWEDRFDKMVAAGLNAVQTYVEWSQHEPYPGRYDFEGILDLVSFIKLAQKKGLLVILRPGPYIDAERDMGGFPFWLLQNNPKMVLRSYDKTYIEPMERWFAKLLPMMKPLLYSNGGPIIAVQVENEYGSHYTCDFKYTSYLRDLFRRYLGNDIVLFTTDGNGDSYLKCGKIQDVYATVDFGPGTNVTNSFATQRNHEPRGPPVNSEYYPGWLDHWAYPHAAIDPVAVIKTLDDILSANASVNMYMFHGGTNFGFTNGANGAEPFQGIPTSYDYGAPLTEAGDTTHLYFEIRSLLSKHTGITPGPVPGPTPKYAYGTVQMKPLGSLFHVKHLLSSTDTPIQSKYPLSFEQLGQAYGFVLYETIVSGIYMDPSALSIKNLADRAHIFIDQNPVGILSREESLLSLPVTISSGQKISILVENQGRVCYGSGINDFKGILSNVTLGNSVLTDWNITALPFNSSSTLRHAIKKLSRGSPYAFRMSRLTNSHYDVPKIFSGSFVAPNKPEFPVDTFVNMNGWFKGIIFVNNFNLGRYWPVVGPQVTLYLPKSVLKPYPAMNDIVIFELEKSPCFSSANGTCSIDLIDTPIINGPTPHLSAIMGKQKFGKHIHL